MVNFQPDRDIPDLAGKVIFITGSSSGLGKETALQLAKHNPAHIFLAARSESKAKEAINEIRNQVSDACPITFVEIELGSFESVKRAVETFQSQSKQLHLLVNNAGIMACPPGTTNEGYEIQFGTNHMGHALLTKLLLPSLQEAAENSSDHARIITLTSKAEAWVPETPWDFDPLKTDMAATSTLTRYGISKMANIHHSRALSRRYPRITCVSIHPGAVSTGLGRGLRSSFPWIASIFLPLADLLVQSVSNGAKNQLWACVSPDVVSGSFYQPVGVVGSLTKQGSNQEYEEALWEWTEQELASYL